MVVFPFHVLNPATIWKKVLSAVVPFHAPSNIGSSRLGFQKTTLTNFQSVTEKLMEDL